MTESSIPYVCFDSRDVRPSERYDYWQHSLSRVCELSFPDHLAPSRFSARNEMWMMGDLLFTQRTCSDHILDRTRRSIRLDQIDHYKLHFRLDGSATTDLTAGDRRIRVRARQCVLTDMAQPEHLELQAGSSVAVIIPRDRLDALLPRRADLHGVVLEGAACALLAQHLQTLTHHIPQLTTLEAPAVTQATLHLVAAALSPTLDVLAQARPAIESTLGRQIRAFIDHRLAEPDLGPEKLCRQFNLSRATLYRLFEPVGGVARYIRERRLLRVHHVLASGGKRQYLSSLADQYGFSNLAHFSRAFRQQFGYSPRDLAMRSHTPPPPPLSAAGYSLPGWLHALNT